MPASADVATVLPGARTRLGRTAWLVTGLALVLVGMVGLFVPLLPTTDFLILALACFARSSPRLEHWLLTHPRFGPSLQAWRAERAIPRHAKIAACAGMSLGYAWFWLLVRPGALPAAAVGFTLAVCGLWIARRPRPSAEAVPSDNAAMRFSDASVGWRTRSFGLGGTAAIVVAGLALATFAWHASPVATAQSAPALVAFAPSAAPPEPDRQVPDGPAKVEAAKSKPREHEAPKLEMPEIAVPNASTPAPMEQTQSTKAVEQTTAPKTLPAPPANRLSSDAEATWEALILAHLEKYRRYPPTARSRREEGTVYVRFSVDRQGLVSSMSILRSSGSAVLDNAALATIRRAQPLPPVPKERADPTELSVPIAFFLN